MTTAVSLQLAAPAIRRAVADLHTQSFSIGVRAALEGYLTARRTPGGFLLAVLRNDLVQAVLCRNGRTESDSPDDLVSLDELVRWLWFHAPDEAWGSFDKVEAWLESRT